MADLDAHAKPPAGLRQVYKDYHRLQVSSLKDRPDLIQFDENRCASTGPVMPTMSAQLPRELRAIFMQFLESSDMETMPDPLPLHLDERPVYRVPNLPGLLIYPSLFPPSVQLSLLEKLLHRDISNSQHQTNVHLHHELSYPLSPSESYFSPSCSDLAFQPKDPRLHKPLTINQFLDKKLRWCTLGGQYDWTAKQYPSAAPPAFPADSKALIESIFPMKAEAAIVNLYSPGDTLSLHRDVSEECAAPLVSISLGCDAIFMCGLEKEDGNLEAAVMRLRSGDAVLMSGESRYAWHGVPKIVEGTCPSWMEDWPGKQYEQWEGWMSGKRVNLNVRQMFG